MIKDFSEKLLKRDGVSRVFCLKCDTLYQDPNGYPIAFTIEYCCGQETETDQKRIDFLVDFYARHCDKITFNTKKAEVEE